MKPEHNTTAADHVNTALLHWNCLEIRRDARYCCVYAGYRRRRTFVARFSHHADENLRLGRLFRVVLTKNDDCGALHVPQT